MTATARKFFTVPEVAVQLRVSAPTVYRLVSRDDIFAVKVGGQIRVPADGLRKYMAGKKSTIAGGN